MFTVIPKTLAKKLRGCKDPVPDVIRSFPGFHRLAPFQGTWDVPLLTMRLQVAWVVRWSCYSNHGRGTTPKWEAHHHQATAASSGIHGAIDTATYFAAKLILYTMTRFMTTLYLLTHKKIVTTEAKWQSRHPFHLSTSPRFAAPAIGGIAEHLWASRRPVEIEKRNSNLETHFRYFAVNRYD